MTDSYTTIEFSIEARAAKLSLENYYKHQAVFKGY